MTWPAAYGKIKAVIFFEDKKRDLRRQKHRRRKAFTAQKGMRIAAEGSAHNRRPRNFKKFEIEMSSSSLSKIEGQQRNVKDYELAAFCEILDLDASELLGLK